MGDFLESSTEAIVGALALRDQFAQLDAAQRSAWQEEIAILRGALSGLDGELFLEFDVPRLGSRIDAVLVSRSAVFPMEFKCGESTFSTAAFNQAWDYGLDLKNFHAGSHAADLYPLLIATGATSGDRVWAPAHPDGVRPPRRTTPSELHNALLEALANARGDVLDGAGWGRAPYRPTPTIVQAARALYSRHTVAAITRSDAGAKNLATTARAVEEVIERSRAERQKSIVFVTGVPGAGKTLVGLDVATRRRDLGESRAVFLSGNQPLVSVLQEALTRDELLRRGPGARKGAVRQEVKPFIQNVHHFRDEGVRRPIDAPVDHVVIFDEAQRAWDREKTADFMKKRKGVSGFTQSESEFLISYLDRHPEWAVVVCLVGGGQEIHTGEAGISAWLAALRSSFRSWHTYISPDLHDAEYAADVTIAELSTVASVTSDTRLHLSTSMRSFRCESVSAFVKAALDCDRAGARAHLAEVAKRYPIVATRDLSAAKQWLRARARGSEQVGLVASSQAMRLKPHAIDLRVSVDPVHWFLGKAGDTRSSNFLEDAATEFQVQGLEVDWACVSWDADFRFRGAGWTHHRFRGDRWTNVNKADRRRYLTNAYRVLLTRARQGMAIFVPPGDAHDQTRQPEFYDGTFRYLTGELGVPVI
ncbi:MAG: DUF2075 domain-containing protein [Vicinamibacterales bacterium]